MEHVPCPACGQEATVLHDGAIYCRAEGRIVPRGLAADAALARGRHRLHERHPPDGVAEAHWRSTGEKLSAFGVFNLVLLILVMATLAAAVAGFVVVVLV
ncbi:hypothetical protein [Capillimicrobium parvum]|uniref:Uncharacterized protein n=1 Tax=Capillimicrobium parvum TaxID=2884022 RepID=A0A9E6XS65_9ACTN|nr:hypothetical protein [Capillimicrobium parvum]UGS33806.1 hypothetical protein DSM104329_00171 [Capillimicrobium parvum]